MLGKALHRRNDSPSTVVAWFVITKRFSGMSDRFFVAHPIDTDEIMLTGPEAHHLIHVMRGNVGQRIVVFDGQGHEAVAEIIGIQKKAVSLRVVSQTTVSRELPIPLTIASPIPKGDREWFLIEKLTELGVSSFVPLITHRSVVRPDGKVIERLRRHTIEACKQCGRNHLMAIQSPVSWPNFLGTASTCDRRVFAHPFPVCPVATSAPNSPSSAADAIQRDRAAGAASSGVVAAVGPEGGFTEEEVNQAIQAGWEQIDLGPRILRTETAAIVLATLLGAARQVILSRLNKMG